MDDNRQEYRLIPWKRAWEENKNEIQGSLERENEGTGTDADRRINSGCGAVDRTPVMPENGLQEEYGKECSSRPVLEEQRVRLACGEEFPMLTFPLLSQCGCVQHGFTTRAGGVSGGEWSSLNLSFTRGDDEAAVKENFRRVAEAFGVKPGQIVCSMQTHTTNVRRVSAQDGGAGVTRPLPWADVDGLITDEPGILLGTFYADCVPLYFVDPVHRAIGLSHSGWRGTVSRMGAVTLAAMADAFGSCPQEVLCAIGPSICQSCYEVSGDVAEQFSAAFPGAGAELLYHTTGDKYQLNLWEANRRVLLDAGVLPEHLQITDICTCCNPHNLFSHRYTGGRRGNLGAFLMLEREGS